jgi:small subunit ribosomal protein S9
MEGSKGNMSDATYYGTGHRKTSIARVWLKPGTGAVKINDRDGAVYLCQDSLLTMMLEPLTTAEMIGRFDILATAKGGGMVGQAGALRHGIAKALLEYDPELRVRMKQGGFLTRDPRVKERKKWGHKRARRGFQFSKR